MKSEVKFISPGLKVSVVIGVCLTVVVIALALLYRAEFSAILLSVAGSVVAIGAVTVIARIYQLTDNRQFKALELEEKRQHLRLVTAQADKAVLESRVLSIPKTQRILMPDDTSIKVIEATTDNYQVLPTVQEQAEPLDLLTVFTQPTQSYACIGGQQTGKTFQMLHIARHWLNLGYKPIVVGPKWDLGEWSGCVLFGGQGNFVQVSQGIMVVRQEAQRRHADTVKRHKDHAILPVFFDDWTPIVDAVDNARELVLQATTLYASVNIILYFILHSDTANAWGVDRKGAALKDNFIKLFIIPTYDTNGLIVREKTRGYIKFAGDSAEYPAKLFNTPLVQFADGFADADFVLDPADLEPRPTPAEAWVLHLHQEGKSYREISQAVWGEGKFGQFYNERIETILQNFGEK